MSTFISPISKSGQITLPAEVRRVLGVTLGDRVSVHVRDGHVSITPVVSFSSLAGSVPPFPGYDPRRVDQYIDEANEAHAAEVIAKMTR